MIHFVKTHAIGNDFLLTEMTSGIPEDYAFVARKICNRYFGVGADGWILWKPDGDRFRLRIFNQDGSEAECSGNGLRCLAAYLIRSAACPEPEVRLETVSGLYTLRQVGEQYEADMGTPAIGLVNHPLEVGSETVNITTCSTGNPHCSLFVQEPDDALVERLGPILERHPLFPKRTNVEFIHVLNEREIEVSFWERGVGVTYASGTGSCGATVACILNGRTGRNVTVHTRAGSLQVEWPADRRLKLTSTANVVAEGRYLEL